MQFDEKTFDKIVLSLLIFLISLENHGNFRLIISIAVICTYILFKPNRFIDRKLVYVVFCFWLILTLITITSYLSYLSYKNNMLGYDNIDFYLSMISKLALATSILYVSKLNKDVIKSSLLMVLKIHIYIFYLQLLVVYASGYYIDLLHPFTGESARYTWGVSVPIIGNIYRPTGLYNEPSTYGAFIICLFALKYSISSRLDRTDKLAIGSLLLSFSFATMACGLLILYFSGENKNNKIIKFSLLSMLVIGILPIILNLLSMRTSGSYDAIGIRMGLFDIIFSQQIFDIIFGSGPVGVPFEIEYLINNPNASWTKAGLPAINDNGLATFLLLKFGVIGFVLTLMYIKASTNTNSKFLCSSILLLTKIKYSSVLFIFYLIFIWLSKRIENEKN